MKRSVAILFLPLLIRDFARNPGNPVDPVGKNG
jgi:hypothetical protein